MTYGLTPNDYQLAQTGNTPRATGNGGENRDVAFRRDIAKEYSQPSNYALLGVTGGWWDTYSAIKSYTGWKKDKAAHNAMKDAKGKAMQTDIAGEEGLAYGFTPTSGSRKNHAAWEAAENEASMAKQVGKVNEAFGLLPTAPGMQGTGTYEHALGANALISGSIERNVGAVRDAAESGALNAAEGGARAAAFGAANSGLTGSSVDDASKRGVLGAFLGGRQDTALAAAGTRSAARGAVEQERIGAIDMVRNESNPGFEKQVADMSMIDSLGQAKRNTIQQGIGSLIGDGGQLYANSLLYGAGAGGTTTSSAALPSLSGGSRRPAGGFSTTGTQRR